MSPWSLLGWVTAASLALVVVALAVLLAASFFRQVQRILREDDYRRTGR